jgi:hypothetical protein
MPSSTTAGLKQPNAIDLLHQPPVGAENLRHLGRCLPDAVGPVTRTVSGGQVLVRAGVR